MHDKHYSLVERPFIPLIGGRSCSLREVFMKDDAENLALDVYHYIAVMRLLFCIGQAAVELKKRADWYALSLTTFKEKVISYLDSHKQYFDLYGEKPFLQIKELETQKPGKSKEDRKLALFIPEIRLKNNLLIHSQDPENFSDAEIALHLIALQLHGFAGKRVDNTIVLTPGYTGKLNEPSWEDSFF